MPRRAYQYERRALHAGRMAANSANVTDPATGAEAMNLPIDVVSSVQVISNPYDRRTENSRAPFRASKPKPATWTSITFDPKSASASPGPRW